jgi:hypothetical protein
MSSDLVIVYHRQPYEEVEENGKIVLKENKSPNGIVPTLKSFFGAVDHGAWVAWKLAEDPANPGFRAGDRDRRRVRQILRLAPAALGPSGARVLPRDVEGGVLADPAQLQGTLQLRPGGLAEFPRSELGLRRGRCRRGGAGRPCLGTRLQSLARARLPAKAAPGPAHRLLPSHALPGRRHAFNVLPWRKEIIESLLACDDVGFHIPRYAANFVSVARSLFDVDPVTREPVPEKWMSEATALIERTMPGAI